MCTRWSAEGWLQGQVGSTSFVGASSFPATSHCGFPMHTLQCCHTLGVLHCPAVQCTLYSLNSAPWQVGVTVNSMLLLHCSVL